eukprot:3644074-Pleurochrysis_carterae.AAC.1
MLLALSLAVPPPCGHPHEQSSLARPLLPSAFNVVPGFRFVFYFYTARHWPIVPELLEIQAGGLVGVIHWLGCGFVVSVRFFFKIEITPRAPVHDVTNPRWENVSEACGRNYTWRNLLSHDHFVYCIQPHLAFMYILRPRGSSA